MKRKELLITSISFGVLLFILNKVALYFELFWTIWWLDLLFHLVGGFVVGSFTVSLFISQKNSFWHSVRTVFLSTLVVALLWESYEFIFGGVHAPGYAMDTISDVLLGLAGGLSALYFIPRRLWK